LPSGGQQILTAEAFTRSPPLATHYLDCIIWKCPPDARQTVTGNNSQIRLSLGEAAHSSKPQLALGFPQRLFEGHVFLFTNRKEVFA
jgi:hypothetical protein